MRLLLVRHAEAAPGEPDELRTLTEQGERQAQELGARAGRAGRAARGHPHEPAHARAPDRRRALTACSAPRWRSTSGSPPAPRPTSVREAVEQRGEHGRGGRPSAGCRVDRDRARPQPVGGGLPAGRRRRPGAAVNAVEVERPAQVVRGRRGRPRHHLLDRRRRGLRPARPERRRQDDHRRDPRGLPQARRRRGLGAGRGSRAGARRLARPPRHRAAERRPLREPDA